MGFAEMIPGAWQVWLDFYCSLAVAQGLLIFLAQCIDLAKAGFNDGLFGLIGWQRLGLVQVIFGLVKVFVFAFFYEQIGQENMSYCAVFNRQRLAEGCFCKLQEAFRTFLFLFIVPFFVIYLVVIVVADLLLYCRDAP